jgi:hypothetical protein
MKRLWVLLAFLLCATFTAQAGVVKTSTKVAKKSAKVTTKVSKAFWKALW